MKAEAQEEERIWVLEFPKVEPDSLPALESKQKLVQKAEKVMRTPLPTVFLLRTNSSIQ